MKLASRRILPPLSTAVLLLLSGCGQSVIVWGGVYFPGWLVAIAAAIPPAILLGRSVQKTVAPGSRWLREPIEIALFVLLFVAIYFLLVWPGASAP